MPSSMETKILPKYSVTEERAETIVDLISALEKTQDEAIGIPLFEVAHILASIFPIEDQMVISSYLTSKFHE